MFRPLIQSLNRRYMDIAFATQGGLQVRIVERPGLWMEVTALDALRSEMGDVARRALAADGLTYGVFSGKADALDRVIITLISRQDGTAVAFNALSVMSLATAPRPTEVLHLGLVLVDPDERSKNMSWLLYGLTCFLIFFRRKFRPIWVSNVTQVPAVVGMFSDMFSEVWPKPNAVRQSLTHRIIARRIMADHRAVFGVGNTANFEEERGVITAAYSGGSDNLQKSWDQAPKHRDGGFNAFCQAELNYERGDDLLQLGKMDMAAMRRFLAREVPKSAVFGLVLAGGMVALQRIVLPFTYWMDAQSDWSLLRAREK